MASEASRILWSRLLSMLCHDNRGVHSTSEGNAAFAFRSADMSASPR